MERIRLTEAQYEAKADAAVQSRLATDRRYVWASDAETQAEAEAAIEREVIAEPRRAVRGVLVTRAERSLVMRLRNYERAYANAPLGSAKQNQAWSNCCHARDDLRKLRRSTA